MAYRHPSATSTKRLVVRPSRGIGAVEVIGWTRVSATCSQA